jgi:hypothetical protein
MVMFFTGPTVVQDLLQLLTAAHVAQMRSADMRQQCRLTGELRT